MSASACLATCPLRDPATIGKIITFEAVEPSTPHLRLALAAPNSMMCSFAFAGCGLPYALRQYDQACSGKLSSEMHLSGFTGALGDKLILDLSELNIRSGAQPRYVMLIGLGVALPAIDRRTATLQAQLLQDTLCASSGAIADAAAEREIEQLAVAFNGLGVHKFKMTAGAAVLRCRLKIELNQHNMPLHHVFILCDPGDRREVEFGLTARRQLCAICTEPRFV